MGLENVKQIGIIGGGASSLMLCFEAAKLGIRTCLLDPRVDCVGSRVASEHIVAALTSENIKKLSLRCDRVIYNTRADFAVDVKLHSKLYPSKDNINELYQFKNILEILELLEIPTAKIFYQDNHDKTVKNIEDISMPFRFIKQYKHYSKQLDITSKKDLAEFIMEVDEEAESFIIQPLSGYKQIASCICVVDESGKVFQYHPIEELTEGENTGYLRIGDTFSKSMMNKLARYNKKLLAEIGAVGAFTIKYGVKPNKSVEFIEIVPELGIGSLLTLEAYDTSVYELMMRLMLEMKLDTPQLTSYAHGTVKLTDVAFEQNERGRMYDCGSASFCAYREEKDQD